MKKGYRIFWAALLLCVISLPAFGQGRGSSFQGLEWGIKAGVNFPRYSIPGPEFDVENKLGWQAGIEIACKFRYFAVGPEINFMRQTVKISHSELGTKRVKTNSVDVPLVFSVRALPFLRIDLGPVFTLMNDCKFSDGNVDMSFGRLRPSVSYMAGLGIRIGARTLIDLRYYGQFGSKECVYPTDEVYRFKISSYTLALSLGVVF